MGKKGLTIVELLMVMVIIAVLVLASVNAYQRAIENTREKQVKKDLAALRGAVELYGYQNGGLPRSSEFDYDHLMSYGVENTTLTAVPAGGTYRYNAALYGMTWKDYSDDEKTANGTTLVEYVVAGAVKNKILRNGTIQ
jgi:prepilin-type N-terminal cleavage/methylation domain-containing protein